MVEPFLFIGGKLTGWFQSHPRKGIWYQWLKGRILGSVGRETGPISGKFEREMAFLRA
jgi:hypothetical protein